MVQVYGCPPEKLRSWETGPTAMNCPHIWIISEGKVYSDEGQELAAVDGPTCPYCNNVGVLIRENPYQYLVDMRRRFEGRQRVLAYLQSRRDQQRLRQTCINLCSQRENCV